MENPERSAFNDTHKFKVSGPVILLPDDADYVIATSGVYMFQNYSGGGGTNKHLEISDTEITSTPTNESGVSWNSNRFWTIYLKAGQHLRTSNLDAKLIPLTLVG